MLLTRLTNLSCINFNNQDRVFLLLLAIVLIFLAFQFFNFFSTFLKTLLFKQWKANNKFELRILVFFSQKFFISVLEFTFAMGELASRFL